MKVNKWTLGLAAVGLVSLPTLVQAEEKLNPVMTALSSTTLSGYIDTSAHWDLGTGNANPPGYIYNAGKQDGFNLNRVKVRLEKPLDEGQWAAGYKFDMLFGPDANFYGTTSTGLNASDFAIQQAYVALRAPMGNGLDLKMGVFDSVIGYESQDGPNNPNYTRSWGATLEPRSHTGLLATYQLMESLGIAAGIANTVSPIINGKAHEVPGLAVGGDRAESFKTYMGSIALTAPEGMGFLQGSTLYAGVVNGFNNADGSSLTVVDWNQTSYYVGATLNTPMTNLKLGVSFDYVDVHGDSSTFGDPDVDGQSAYANATALYASLQATEKLSFHLRGEYMSHSFDQITTSWGSYPDKVVSVTGTVQYDLWKNVLSRLEIRWDHDAAAGEGFGGETAGSPTLDNAVLVAANLVYKF